MLEKFLNIFRIPDLRKRVLFTLGILAVYRLGAFIPTPGVNTRLLELLFSQQSGSALGLMDLFGGGNLRRMTVFALGIMPYITASIIFQLLTVVYEPLARIQKEGELGRRKITQWTRYMTVVLGALQSIGISAILTRQGLVLHPGIGFSLMTVLTLTTGTAFIMWLGEQITDRGVGNGISLLIFAGIVIGLPRGVQQVMGRVSGGDTLEILGVIAMVVALVAIIAFIVFVEAARRKIPVSYAKRHVGRQLVGGQQTTMPLKLNMGGVIPVIFASSVLSMPQSLFSAFPPKNPANWYAKIFTFFQVFHAGDPYYELIFLTLIMFFTFFYVSIVFNVEEVADNLRKHGGFMPGIRPGRATAEYLNTILTRLTTVGAIYLAMVAFFPQFMLSGYKVARLPLIGTWLDSFVSTTPGLQWIPTGMGYQFYFGGTSLLILVGVAMDTVSQIEAQLVMRNYEGFLGSGGRLRGRRA